MNLLVVVEGEMPLGRRGICDERARGFTSPSKRGIEGVNMQKVHSGEYLSMKFQWRMLLLIGIFLLLLVPFPQKALSETWNYDLGFVDHQDVWFSSSPVMVGKSVRMYARVHNFGKRDAAGFVSFFQSNILIGYSQPISIVSGSVSDEVFVDFAVPSGSFNILVKVEGVEPMDENGTNNQILTQLFVPQYDNDNDGIGDEDDKDDDNDGVEDDTEKERGTIPTLSDTDGDGVNDSDDPFPLDPLKGKPEERDEISLPITEAQQGIVEQKEEDQQVASLLSLESTASQDIVSEAEDTDTQNVAFSYASVLGGDTEDISPKVTSLKQEALPASSLPPLSDVYIIVKRRDWNTYVFLTNIVDTSQYRFSWNFGDSSAQVEQNIVEHTFPWMGEYVVTVAVKNDQGVFVASQTTSVPISFFHLDNIWIWGFVGILILIINLCVCFWRRLLREEDEIFPIRKKGQGSLMIRGGDKGQKKEERGDSLETDLDWFIDDE